VNEFAVWGLWHASQSGENPAADSLERVGKRSMSVCRGGGLKGERERVTRFIPIWADEIDNCLGVSAAAGDPKRPRFVSKKRNPGETLEIYHNTLNP